MANPTVEEIVKEYLEANGYGGLFHNGDCGCPVDELRPCMETFGPCEAGYLHAPPENSEFDWMIKRAKPEPQGGDDGS